MNVSYTKVQTLYIFKQTFICALGHTLDSQIHWQFDPIANCQLLKLSYADAYLMMYWTQDKWETYGINMWLYEIIWIEIHEHILTCKYMYMYTCRCTDV